MKLKTYFAFLIGILLFGCQSPENFTNNPSAYELVNPFIGTGGHGHTYPGATLPFGMVQLSPDTRLEGWDGCSGYHYSDSIIYGFSHTHLSGTGVSDYGDILIMPTQGDIVFENGSQSGVANGYASLFKKESEKANPGYYEVTLEKNNIDVRLTTTTRVGIHEYTFNESGKSNVILDLTHRDRLLLDSLHVIDKQEIVGSRISQAWAEEQHVYFVMKFSSPFISPTFNTEKTKAAFTFENLNKRKLLIKVGISAVSIEGARKNLRAEASHWDFDQYQFDAKGVWEKALQKIEVEGPDNDNKSIFYTALYHTMIAPNTFSDTDGKYRGMDKKIYTSSASPIYSVFSLWDTFRGAHPLYTIIEQEKTNQFINTFLSQYKSGGILPIWELAGNYTGCMIGYHSIPVIADAYTKGIRNYDENLALNAMIHSSLQDKLGLDAYKSKGYIGVEDEAESVSKTLEYAYDDWCISKMASQMKKDSIFHKYIGRAQYYKNVFNPEVGFMQSKINGGWGANFDPAEVNFNFTEANSWQYSLFAPHDIQGLISLYGGVSGFEKQLDDLFSTKANLSGRHQVDITGLIGQYAHGNEPSHHMAYLYNYIGKPWKTQEKVDQILSEQYFNKPNGLSGNEDCGQMSAWYVLSSMGIYSVTPGLDYYAIGKPHFEKAIVSLENGNQFVIQAKNYDRTNIYIQSAMLNGEDYNQSYLYHKDIMKGGLLIFEMGDTPNKKWAKWGSPKATIAAENLSTPVPYFSTSSQTFTDTLSISIKSIDAESDYYYSINDADYKKYENKINITKSCNIKSYAIRNNKKSFEIKASYKKIKGGRSITIESKYSNQYAGGGAHGLIDFLKGNANFRSGYWQGYEGIDFSGVVDLGKIEEVKRISVGALQDIKSWIWFPKNVKISTSDDGSIFKEINVITNDFSDDEYGAFIKQYSKNFSSPIKTRYIKIEAENYGPCPKWHSGNGNPTWLFLDEISIE